MSRIRSIRTLSILFSLASVPSVTQAQGRPAIDGFREGHVYVGPRIWAGVYGSMAFGVQAEKAITAPRRDLGNGRFGVSASVDTYSYGDAFAGTRWSYRVVPVTAMLNYHFTLKDGRIDPYIGAGLGYSVVSADVEGPFIGSHDARASAMFFGAQVGARYFLKPNLALQAQTGVGLGAFSLGATWRL